MSDTAFSLAAAAAVGAGVAALGLAVVLGGLHATTTNFTRNTTIYKTIERAELVVHCPSDLVELLQEAIGRVHFPTRQLNLPLGASAVLDPLIIAHHFALPYRCELVPLTPTLMGEGSNSATATTATIPVRYEPNVDSLYTLPVHLAGTSSETEDALVLVLTNYSNQVVHLEPTDSLARLVAPFPVQIERITFRPYAYVDAASPTSSPPPLPESESKSDAKS